MAWATTAVGIQNRAAAHILGEWAGVYITNTLRTKAKVLIVGLPTQADTRDRVAGFTEGLEASGAGFQIVQEVNGGGLKDQAFDVSADSITRATGPQHDLRDPRRLRARRHPGLPGSRARRRQVGTHQGDG